MTAARDAVSERDGSIGAPCRDGNDLRATTGQGARERAAEGARAYESDASERKQVGGGSAITHITQIRHVVSPSGC